MPITDLNTPPELLYRIRLDNGISGVTLPIPIVDHLDPSWGPAHPVGIETSAAIEPGGMRLQLLRPPTADAQGLHTALLWNFSPVPPAMRRCYLSADFQFDTSAANPFSPDGAGAQWAASVIVRDGNQQSVIDDSTTVVGATHQVIGGATVLATLGAGNVMGAITPPPRLVAVPISLVHDAASLSFTLGTFIDFESGQGQSYLTTSGGYYWEDKFTHPFGPLPSPPKMATSAGFGLAIATGSGWAQVIVKEFRVQIWPFAKFPVAPVGGIAGR